MFIGILGLLLNSSTPAATGTETYSRYDGEARSADGRTLIYREHHLLRIKDGVLNGRIVLYACPEGPAFARKVLDYSGSLTAPDLRFEDHRAGSFRQLETLPTGRRLTSRKNLNSKTLVVPVVSTPGLVADAGFDEFIHQSWASLMTNRPINFNLLLLTDGSVLTLKGSRLRHEELHGEQVEVFNVELTGLLGLIAPNIVVSYSSADHVLRRFQGLSPVQDEQGREVKTVIDFPATPNIPADAALWASQLSQPLVTHCNP